MSLELLFVDACPRREDSRTRALAERFLRTLRGLMPGLRVTVHDLPVMGLSDVNARRLAEKEALCDGRIWDRPLTRVGADFRRADAVAIAAPYWDLSFPSILKTWVENIWVRNLTFVYRDDQPVGLARGRAAVYLTTSGSAMTGHDWGTGYMEDVLHTLGIPAFRAVKAERLDLDGADTGAILRGAEKDAEAAAAWMAGLLTAEIAGNGVDER